MLKNNDEELYFIFIYVLASPQGHGYYNSISQYCVPDLPNTPCQLSLLEETGVPGQNLELRGSVNLYSFHRKTGLESYSCNSIYYSEVPIEHCSTSVGNGMLTLFYRSVNLIIDAFSYTIK